MTTHITSHSDAHALAHAKAPVLQEGFRQSRVGKRPIALPKGVTVSLKGERAIDVKGPKGTLSRELPAGIKLQIEGGNVVVTPTVPGRDGARFQGLAWALIRCMITGVSEGYTKTLQLVGTGYRAELKAQVVHMSLGFSHPIDYSLPEGVTAKVDKNFLILTGIDRQALGQATSKIRSFRPPEPYKGKGIKYVEETILRKAGKTAGK